MSYLQFLLIFVCIPIVVLAWVLRGRLRRLDWLVIIGLAIVAVIYTTPWDNYLVATGVWYYNPKLVLNITLGYVPLEEYLFFILQSFMTGLWGLWLWKRLSRPISE